ncbi:MAG: flagellar basal body-associated FliL family protein [Burkholderiaceae bacterium]|nr:flagellar basal body-associated FliL family protein [Burkholderiaceae bacterium]
MSEAASVTEIPRPNRAKKWTLGVGVAIALTVAAVGGTQLLRSDGDDAPAAARKREPVFVSLEQFTVNLSDEGGERFAQIGVTLEVADERVDKALRARMPAVRNSVLLLISSKKSEELLTLDGKKRLAEQIAATANAALDDSEAKPSGGASPIAGVNFSHFIVQ